MCKGENNGFKKGQEPEMPSLTGAQIAARSLHGLGVNVIFGIVGIPVVEVAEEAINLGIRFIAFRNEQACSYAASVYGYMSGKPGVCLVVGGPGVLHGIAGVSSRWIFPRFLLELILMTYNIAMIRKVSMLTSRCLLF